ncbi:MAG: histidine kinase [Acidobacteria bacterium]|nr:histidine kinase [Acidobacteriota bacterium]
MTDGHATSSLGVLLPFCCLSCVLLLAEEAYSQDSRNRTGQYVHELWRTEDGLPVNSVQAIRQARDGYLWIGTQEGLVRFDGARFTVFDSANTAAITNNYFTSLLVDREGGVWAGTFGGGVVRYRHGALGAQELAGSPKNRRVRCLYEDSRGSVWIGSDAGLTRWLDGKATTFDAKNGLPGGAVTSLCEDRDGDLWIGTRTGGLSRLSGAGSFGVVSPEGFPAARSILCLAADKAGRMWIGTGGHGLWCYENGRVRGYTIADGLPDNAVRSLCEDREGGIWIGTDGGICRFAGGGFSRYATGDAIDATVVLAICQDVEGSLWVGTLGAGMHRLRRSLFLTYGRREGLSHDSTTSIYEDRSGNVWVGTAGGGLNRLKDGELTTYTTKNGLPSNFVLSLWEDLEGTLWVGTTAGLSWLKNGVIGKFDSTQSPAAMTISALYVDREGFLWIGTAGGGLLRYRDGQITAYGREQGLQSDSVWAIHQDREGTLWIGTMGGGLSRLARDTISFVGSTDVIGGDIVFAFHEDSAGAMWIGTNGGLCRLQGSTITKYSTRDGLLSDTIFRVLEDSHGNLWMSCSKGIFRVNKQHLLDRGAGRSGSVVCIGYDTADGLRNVECNGGTQPAGWRDTRGRLWFPTNGGVAVIDAEGIETNRVPPPVFIEEVLIDQRRVESTGTISISPDSRSFELHYTALSLLVPRRVRFRYFLEGFDREWVDAGARRAAYYTNIPPGRYRFKVVACNNDGVWNRTGAAFELSLPPHYYQTYWFYGLCALATALATGVAHRLRIRQVQARGRALAVKVDEALAHIRILRGMLPICASCKNIRDDKGYWNQIEMYIRDHSEAEFSHGICPDCMKKLYPDFVEKRGSEDAPETPSHDQQ